MAERGAENDEGIKIHRSPKGVHPEAGRGGRAGRGDLMHARQGSASRPTSIGKSGMAGCCSTSSAESSFAKRLEPVASAGSPRPHTRTYQWDAGRVRPPLGRVAHLLLPCLWQVNFCATRRTTACGNAAAQDQQLRPAAMGRNLSLHERLPGSLRPA